MKRTVLPDFSAAKGRRLLVALSGGSDSVALLCMLAQQQKELGIALFAAHVNHCIRGEESQADADFCRSLCEGLNVPLQIEVIDVPAVARETGEGLETAARRLRYAALRRIQADFGADWIALAHHQNDQAETVLMHLLRGCGPDGIGGMSMLSGDLYRPLLSTPKRALEDWLTESGHSWRVDSTNLEACTPRNALRLHVLPALEESYPAAASAIARYAEAAQCENRLMEKLTCAFLESHLECGAYGVRIRRPEATDEAILRRAIRSVCGEALTHDKLTALIALCEKKRGKAEISGSLNAERTPSALYFLPKRIELPEPVPLPDEGTVQFGNLGAMTVRPSAAAAVRDDPYRQVLSRDALKGAVLRTRRDGDRIRPLGCGDKLLSDYLTDRKIDRPLRDTLPLAAIGDRILWAVGVGISEDAALRPDTRHAIELIWNTTSDK